jgi:hypothetical protein
MTNVKIASELVKIAEMLTSAFPVKNVDKAEGFDHAFGQFVIAMQAMVNKYMEDEFPTNPKKRLEVSEGGRYVKIAVVDSQKSAWAFIDKSNGDVLKPASWAAPAKGARANIFNQATWKNVGVYGPAYKRGPSFRV